MNLINVKTIFLCGKARKLYRFLIDKIIRYYYDIVFKSLYSKLLPFKLFHYKHKVGDTYIDSISYSDSYYIFLPKKELVELNNIDILLNFNFITEFPIRYWAKHFNYDKIHIDMRILEKSFVKNGIIYLNKFGEYIFIYGDIPLNLNYNGIFKFIFKNDIYYLIHPEVKNYNIYISSATERIII